MAATYYGPASDVIKGAILRMGALAGDAHALELERKALASGQDELAAAALRALARWPNASAADDLLKQAKEADQDVDRLVALRGYIRIAGLETVKLPNAERMQMLKTATALAERDDERKQIINSLQQVTTVEALRILEKYLDKPTLQAEAEVAAANLIWKIRRDHPQEVTPIAERLKLSKNRKVAEQARRTLNDVTKN